MVPLWWWIAIAVVALGWAGVAGVVVAGSVIDWRHRRAEAR